ncbi:MAG: RNA polymerase [Rhizobiaceae bacterium]|jgi:RNA polymerase sigma-70 factor (ECF subfamily)|nr:RNA polymerase [Rhizobiaceae bacterium]
MTQAASGALAVTKAITRLAREDRGRLLSALIAKLGDFSLAEEALQDAMVSAVEHWGRSGIPASPQGWLLSVANRKAIDRIRKGRTQARIARDLVPLLDDEAREDNRENDRDMIPDERLRLIFTCCHPAIEQKSQVALTLRTLGGLSTCEIARAFLDQEATMGQRLSRAKAKIAAARIPFAVPDSGEWQERLNAVLCVIYLIFNAGYTAGPTHGRDLADEAIWLARILNRLRPGDPEIEGCLALMLLTDARRAARLSEAGATVALAEQDRTRWNRGMIGEGVALVETALARGRPGPYQIKAAIAACHCEGDHSDWLQIAALYGVLATYEPTPIVRLNAAVARAEAGALAAAIAELDALEDDLDAYQPFHAARAELARRAGNMDAARHAYRRAVELAPSPADAAFLEGRLDTLHQKEKAEPSAPPHPSFTGG